MENNFFIYKNPEILGVFTMLFEFCINWIQTFKIIHRLPHSTISVALVYSSIEFEWNDEDAHPCLMNCEKVAIICYKLGKMKKRGGKFLMGD